ncbi:MAG: response regulator [Candidatus Falkowbacteria bacterium]
MNAVKKIAVIEDDRFLRKVYETKLPRQGYAVVSAEDGEAGLALIKQELPDVVLLDLIMPKMTGFEVLAALKSDKKTAKIPVVVLSNLGQEEDIARAKELGASEFLVKSNLTIKDVMDLIEQILK